MIAYRDNAQTDIRIIEAMKLRPERCPWNPFPADSIWGRRLDQDYRRDQRQHTMNAEERGNA